MAQAYNPWDVPSLYLQILSPLKLLVRILDFLFSLIRPHSPVRRNVTVVCISDTHNLIPEEVPYGDIIIHAGDLTNGGTAKEIQAQINWLESLPHKHKIAIAGNHDSHLDPRSRGTLRLADRQTDINWRGITYLQDSYVICKFPWSRAPTPGDKDLNIKIYGSPFVPQLGGPEHAFQHPRKQDVWTGKIPEDADIVVTHTPPRYHLDLPGVQALGDENLLREIRRTKPALHVFGHVHAARSDFLGELKGGQEVVRWDLAERHLEGVLEQASPLGIFGFMVSMLNIFAWYHLIGFWFYSLRGLVHEMIFWREPPPATRMVNAALQYCDEKRLGNSPQVVHI